MYAGRRFRISPLMPAIVAAALIANPVAHAQVVSTLILRTGDIAPQLGTAPVFIQSFVEPPSISDAYEPGECYVPIRVTVEGETVVPQNQHVMYVWSCGFGLRKIVRTSEVASFPTTARAIVALESPIAGPDGVVAYTVQTDRPARGLVVNRGVNNIGMVEVGDAVSIACESVSGPPCGPVAGTLSTMATFGDRKGAALGASITGFDPPYTTDTVVAFRGAVQTTGFGVPDALWRIDTSGGRGPLVNLANSLLHADGITGPPVAYYDDFTDVAMHDADAGPIVYGLATVSQGAPFVAYQFNENGSHDLLLRHHAPDLVPRRDFHVAGRLAFAGGVTATPLDGRTFTRGVWTMRRDGSDLTQVYYATLTPAPGIPGATLGPPIGQALVNNFQFRVFSVFAANLVGSSLAGAAGVWRGVTAAEDPGLLVLEQHTNVNGSAVQAIWGVHVNSRGDVAFHTRLQDQRQAIFVIDVNNDFIPVLLAGDPLPGSGGSLVMDSFWTLGVTFGADPVVTGNGDDGIQGAFSEDGEIPVVVYTRSAGQPPGSTNGAALLHVAVPLSPLPPLFADGFEAPPPPD